MLAYADVLEACNSILVRELENRWYRGGLQITSSRSLEFLYVVRFQFEHSIYPMASEYEDADLEFHFYNS